MHGHEYQWEIRNYYQKDAHFGNGWGITTESLFPIWEKQACPTCIFTIWLLSFLSKRV